MKKHYTAKQRQRDKEKAEDLMQEIEFNLRRDCGEEDMGGHAVMPMEYALDDLCDIEERLDPHPTRHRVEHRREILTRFRADGRKSRPPEDYDDHEPASEQMT